MPRRGSIRDELAATTPSRESIVARRRNMVEEFPSTQALTSKVRLGVA